MMQCCLKKGQILANITKLIWKFSKATGCLYRKLNHRPVQNICTDPLNYMLRLILYQSQEQARKTVFSSVYSKAGTEEAFPFKLRQMFMFCKTKYELI